MRIFESSLLPKDADMSNLRPNKQSKQQKVKNITTIIFLTLITMHYLLHSTVF